MKNNFFKIVLPMAVVALGLAGAANTNAMDKSGKSVAIMGYKHISNPNSCVADQECSNTGNFNCTAADGSQLYAKPASTCLTPLKRDVQ